MHISRRTTLLAVVGLTLTSLQLLQLSPAQAAGKPDLVVTGLTVSAPSVVAGKAVKVGDTTKNAGAAKAGASVTRYYLSTDKKWSKTDPVLGSRKVGALASGKHDGGAASVKVPAPTKARSYWVLACADATKKVAESKETNNCRASGAQLKVKAPATTGVFPQTPNPITVTPTEDAAHAVSGDWSFYTGLTLTQTVGSTTYTLRLPGIHDAQATPVDDSHREALSTDGTTVTMTPVTAVGGLPGSASLLAAVKLEPEGLLLENPGTLTVSGPSIAAAPVADQTGIVWNAGGTDLSMSPILTPALGGSNLADTIVLSISHFSTPAVAAASPSDRNYLLDHPPAREREQLQAQAAKVLLPEHVKAVNGQPTDPNALAKVIQLYDDWFDNVVVKELKAAVTNDAIADTALDDAFAWERFVMVNGVDPGARGDLITAYLPKIVQNVINRAYDGCVNDHYLPDILRMLKVAHWMAIIGGEALSQDAYTKVQACAHFQVRLLDTSSTSYQHYPASGGFVDSRSQDGHWSLPQVNFDVGASSSNVGVTSGYASASFSRADTGPGPDSCGGSVTVTTTLDSTGTGNIIAKLVLDLNAYEVAPGHTAPAPVGGKVTLTFVAFTETYHSHNGCTGENSPSGTGDRFSEALGQALGSDASPTFTEKITPGQQQADLLLDKTVSATTGAGDRTGARYSAFSHVFVYHTPTH